MQLLSEVERVLHLLFPLQLQILKSNKWVSLSNLVKLHLQYKYNVLQQSTILTVKYADITFSNDMNQWSKGEAKAVGCGVKGPEYF